MKPYETRFGRTLPTRALRAVVDRIKRDEDCQRIITEELRDFIPVHEDDLDEAMEVYGHCEELADEELEAASRRSLPPRRRYNPDFGPVHDPRHNPDSTPDDAI